RWTYEEDKPAEIEYLVVDIKGKPVTGVPVKIQIQRQETKAARVKGAGNAYLTNYVTQWVDAGKCEGLSGVKPSVCRFTPQEPGRYQISATIQDSKQRTHATAINAWVLGKGRVLWQEANNYSLQIVPEKNDYKVGDTARFLVKNPFPGAQALITVERYGVLKHWIQTLEGNTPVIEVPVEADYLPGFYMSVLVTSPRVHKPLGAGNVDLGKPTFRLGYVKVPVKDLYKQIDVVVTTKKEVYKPRESVRAQIQAVLRHDAQGSPIEIAVAVVDEAVFDLNRSGRNYYDPYKGFNRLEGLDLNNYSLLTRLVGRQKFEKKGASPGGGGADSGLGLRNLFKFVSYWNPSIQTDHNGLAQIEFALPDNLTSWRILAMAVTPGDRMGLGDVSIKVNRPTELRPVMPNQIIEGDEFQAGFSVMNRTGERREVTVEIRATGEALDAGREQRSEIRVSLQPFKRQTVWLPIETRHFGHLKFLAVAKDALDSDAIEHRLVVNKRRSLVTAANYGTTTQSAVVDKVAFPEGIFTDVGGISVVASPSVIGNIDGAFSYIRDYPYECWEQQLTKGVMASHYQNLKAYMPEEFQWKGSRTLAREVLDAAASFQAPNGGMTYWLPHDRYVSPYLSAYTALAFNWLRKSNYRIPTLVEEKLHEYLKRLLRRDVLPDFYTRGMASSVRAVALAALAEHSQITLGDLQRHRPHLAEMDLFGKAHFLQAAVNVNGGRPMADETARMILSHSSQSGGKFQFNEVWDDSYSYILATPLRSNAAVLSSLMHLVVDADGLALVGDIPFKQVRAMTQSRGNRDHWENTQENVFCLNALVDYSRIYETEKPDMIVRAYLGDRKIGEARFADLRAEAVTFEDPIRQASPGLKTEVKLEKQGPGRLYYATRMHYAPTEDNAERINAGMQIRREYAVERDGGWVLLKSPMQIKRGELVRVDIFLSLPTLRHFVVVDDPVPGGLEPVNRDLATASTVDADKGQFKAIDDSWWFTYSDWSYYGRYGYSFYHKELRHDSARFYADYMPAGNYHLSYTAQAIAEGRFAVLPVHAEEMYDPDVFGKGLPAVLNVSHAK
ncbi:MAG: large extracellular alpha-helical protein, partial [Gammaproteobacteria bacterium]|nr:large extracellular alpha-helical protein [Gammaproteobacteria bacterium]